MKLWEAILIGCDRRGQAFTTLFHKEKGKEEVTSCALGAAIEGAFGKPSKRLQNRLRKNFLILGDYVEWSRWAGDAGITEGPLEDLIVHMNDGERWPRERIALEIVKPIEEAEDEEG